MTQWYVKDLSQLTGVSVQTMHHYDRIGLLKPSLRLKNGYRVYSKQDLLKLQQIIALKFFGFELAQIKNLLSEEQNVVNHFKAQIQVLEQKAAAMSEGAKTLKSIIDSVDNHQSIPWKAIIQLIKVYKMAEHLEHDWVKEIFTPDELKQYAEFEKTMKTNNTKEAFQNEWRQLLDELKQNVHQDPDSNIGVTFGEKYMAWLNRVYGKKYAHLRTKKWEQGFGEGKGLDEIGLTRELMTWIEQALDAYWKERFHHILTQVGKIPDTAVLKLWNQALDDLYGEETTRKKTVYDLVLNDTTVSIEIKAWLKNFANPE